MKDISFKMISTSSTDIRCLIKESNGQSAGNNALRCSDPSTESTCVSSMQCEDCADVSVPVSGFSFGSVQGQCGCTSNCNDDKSCTANAILNNMNQCECLWDNIATFDSSFVETCSACTNLETVGNGNVLRDSTKTCACMPHAAMFSTGASPHNCECMRGYTKAVDRTSGSDVYSCVDCSNVIASGSYDGSSFDCQLGSNIGVSICGNSALPEASGMQYVCKCATGYLEASDGSCVACSDVVAAEGGTGSSSASKLFATGSTAQSCSCGNNAKPNVSSKLCECNSDSVISSEYFNLGNDERKCFAKINLVGVGADTTTGECGLNAFLDENGACSCLTTTNSVAGSVWIGYVQSNAGDFCYEQNYAEECFKDNTANTEGYVSATCSASGFLVKVNGACHTAKFSYFPTDKWYVGNTASTTACQVASVGNDYEVTVPFTDCDVASASNGAGTDYTLTLKFDSSFTTEYTIADLTWVCNYDGTSAYSMTSTRSGKVNMLPTMSEYLITNLASVVGITFDNSLSYALGDTITVAVNEIQAGYFNYRIDDIWLTTDPTSSQPYASIDTNTYKRIKIFENGCQRLPEVSNNGLTVEMYAVGFADLALPQTIYMRATVLACPLTMTCTKTCTAISGGWTAPSRRRRRSSLKQTQTLTGESVYQFSSNDTYLYTPIDGDAILIPRRPTL